MRGSPSFEASPSCREHVVVQAHRGGRQPFAKAVLAPLRWPEQQHAGGLNQQGSQVLLRFDKRPRIVRSPVEVCLGTSSSQAPKLRPRLKAAPFPMAAAMALAMIGPTPGTLIGRYKGFDLAGGVLA
jgi:hypothetical protein